MYTVIDETTPPSLETQLGNSWLFSNAVGKTSVDIADLSTVEAKRYELRVFARSTDPAFDVDYKIHIHINDVCKDATLDALETNV